MGRPAGVPNKPKRRLLARLEEDFPEYHPVVALASMVHCDCEAVPGIHRLGRGDCPKMELETEHEIRVHAEIAKYVEPQLSRTVVKGNVDHKVVLFKSDADL